MPLPLISYQNNYGLKNFTLKSFKIMISGIRDSGRRGVINDPVLYEVYEKL